MPKSTLTWVTESGGTLTSRAGGYLFVVRPDVDKPTTIRFAVLKELPTSKRLLHVICGRRKTVQTALGAAERAAAVLAWGDRHGWDASACRAAFCSTRPGSRDAFRPDHPPDHHWWSRRAA